MSKHHGLLRVAMRAEILLALVTALLLTVATAFAEDKEPLVVLELGAAGQWGINGGGSSFGPTAAVEFSPIKNLLEIETGITTLFSRGQTEWDADFIFKKSFDLSPFVEFEPGIGPVWMHTIGSGHLTDTIGVEAVADFMFWPTRDRQYGWFLEPSYSYSLANGHAQSFGVSGGLLIPIKQWGRQ
jgi:hypothetical protein